MRALSIAVVALMLMQQRVAICSEADSMSVTVSLLADMVYSSSNATFENNTRLFTLQPSVDRTVGLMQGQIKVAGTSRSLWWNLTIQEGWFTKANYLGEDAKWRFLQEASVHGRVSDKLVIRAGVMPSHIGYESMIARENITLSRSFTADNTPYYETGVAARYEAQDNLTVQFLVLNGWQRIVDNNDDISCGTSVSYVPHPKVEMSWNTYLGNDQPRGSARLLRLHNNFWTSINLTEELTLVGLLDVGIQERAQQGTSQQWYAGAVSRYSITENLRIAGRIEHYSDPDAFIVQTPLGGSFTASAASINADFRLLTNLLIRGEWRTIHYNDAFLNRQTATPRSSESYVTLSISTAFGNPL
jgi:hypothetical protein